MPRKVTIQLEVTAPDNMEDNQIAGFINEMIAIGFQDGIDTLNNPDCEENWPEAEEATSLVIGTAEVIS